MAAHGAERFYAKRLAPNDNSKNQVYLGGGFSALNIIPHGPIEDDVSNIAGSVRDRAKASVRFFWLDEQGLSPAPNAQLILYPKYPEVRMSGFLLRAERAPSELMRSRDEGRVLFLGICEDGRVLGQVVPHYAPVAQTFGSINDLPSSGVFLNLDSIRLGADPKAVLLAELRRIHEKGWIASQKLGVNGTPAPYTARNGGGYTLEAELGVSPNGYSEPDFMGWEVKQYAVGDFITYRAKGPVTLLTPEPTGGFYRDEGAEAFVRRFGYADKSGKIGRLNFGGIYSTQHDFHKDTGLALKLQGFDIATGKITNMDGAITLVDQNDTIAATWGFKGIISHWNRKHAMAAYVPSIHRTAPVEYSYGNKVTLCEGTDVLLLLTALSTGKIYYDPAIKLENMDSAKPALKRRSQFRVKHSDLTSLYQTHATHSFE